MDGVEGACTKLSSGRTLIFGFVCLGVRCLPLAVADVQPAGAVALAARFLISRASSQAGRASLPVGFVLSAANDAGAALASRDLQTLAVDHLRGIGHSAAARAHRRGLGFLSASLSVLVRSLLRNRWSRLAPNLFILETARPRSARESPVPKALCSERKALLRGGPDSIPSLGSPRTNSSSGNEGR